jgi:hypothetical protein
MICITNLKQVQNKAFLPYKPSFLPNVVKHKTKSVSPSFFEGKQKQIDKLRFGIGGDSKVIYGHFPNPMVKTVR